MEKDKFFYRYRSMHALLDEYNELEDEYIYFSPAKDLNDPLEGHLDIDFKGDKIIWTNFFKNYIFSLFIFRGVVYLTGNSKKLSEDDIHVDFNPDLKESLSVQGQAYQIVCDEILSNECINYLIDHFSTRDISISKNELYSCLLSIHFYILDIFTKIDIEKGMEIQDRDALYKRLNSYPEEQSKLIKMLEFIKKLGDKGFEALNMLLPFSNNNLESMLYARNLTSLNDNIADKNYNLLISYPKIYLNKLYEIMYPRPYIACFSESYKDLSMWGYYADSSKGACLIFKPIKKNETFYLPLEMVTSWGGDGKTFHESKNFVDKEVKPVIYSKQKPATPFFRSLGRLNFSTLQRHWYMLDTQISKIVEDIFDESGKDKWRKEYWEHIEKNTNTKQQDWSHEQEYRISLIPIFDDQYDTISKRKLKYKFDNLEGLIFGINTTETDKVKIIKTLFNKCKKYNRTDFKLYQAVYDNQNGDINIIPINILKYIKEI